MKKKYRALVLNADYTPVCTIGWKRAIVLALMYQEHEAHGLQEIDFYKGDFILSGGGTKYPIPAVLRHPNYLKTHRKNGVPFSRKNIFIRDNITCQYCGFRDGNIDKLTFDHVIPRDIWIKKKYPGTPTQWTNIVTSCIKCNRRKANKLLKHTDMKLSRQPVKPNSYNFVPGLTPWTKMPKEWKPYLPNIYRKFDE